MTDDGLFAPPSSDDVGGLGTTSLYLGDCREVVASWPDDGGFADAVITDPPYEIGGDVVRSGGRRIEQMPDWDRWVSGWVGAVVRAMLPDSSLVAFTDTRRVDDMWRLLEEAGLVPRQMVYWVKHAPPPNPRRCFQSAVEVAVWATRGKYSWGGGGLASNVWFEGPVKGVRVHPAQKPVALMRWLCRLLCPPGGTVLDPFMGSGSTGVAAVRQGFLFVGIEKDADYFRAAKQRIASARLN